MMMMPPCRAKGIDGLHQGGKVETVSYEKPGNMILTQGAEVCTGLELKVSDSHYYFNMGEGGSNYAPDTHIKFQEYHSWQQRLLLDGSKFELA